MIVLSANHRAWEGSLHQEKPEVEVEVGEGVKKDPTQIFVWDSLNFFPNQPPLREPTFTKKWFTKLKEVGTRKVRVLTFVLTRVLTFVLVINLGIQTSRKKMGVIGAWGFLFAI